jgi:FtsP/CotA-like multicopper oxidase with cupredoxin domain
MSDGIVAANFSAPTIHVKEGEELYLTLTNAGFLLRPDLADPHSVHYHGFSNAGDIFDGLPEASITINAGASFTYYYNNVEPGTYMYHCHVEAPEHMQMGMLGNLYVEPAQDGTPIGGYTKFAYKRWRRLDRIRRVSRRSSSAHSIPCSMTCTSACSRCRSPT